MTNEKGISLLEVLASVVILGIVVTSFVLLTSYTRLANVSSDRSSEAVIMAESKLNYLRNVDSDEVAAKIDEWNEQTQYDGQTYAVYVTTSSLAAGTSQYTVTPNANFREKFVSATGVISIGNSPAVVVVTVSWQEV